MNNRVRPLYIFVVAVIVLFGCDCTNSNVAGTGTGTEDVNAKVVTGKVVTPGGAPAAFAEVTLIPDKYDPIRNAADTLLSDTTNADGVYMLRVPDSGRYSVLIIQITGRTRAVLSCQEVQNDTTRFPPAVLLKPGKVKVTIPHEATSEGYLYIPGTTVYAYVNNDRGFVVLDSVPAGGTADIAYCATDTSAAQVVRYAVPIEPEQTAMVWNPGWEHAHTLRLNTSATGAANTETVTSFPLLIRLREENFDFSQALDGGADVRFTNSYGVALPHEVVLWDTASLQADIWVMVDTVFGNNATQYITMYWGNRIASDSLMVTTMYSATDGYRGVWHLNGGERTIDDASANRFVGTKQGDVHAVRGVIGGEQGAQYFDGNGDHIAMGNVGDLDSGSFTISGWIKKTGTDKKIHTIFSKSRAGSASPEYGWLLQLDTDGALGMYAATAQNSWGGAGTFILTANEWIADSAWHHIAVSVNRSNNECRMFIDAKDVSSLPIAGTLTDLGVVVNDAPMVFGADGNGNNAWQGAMDEFRVESVARTQDYVRLCYMNQKSSEALINW